MNRKQKICLWVGTAVLDVAIGAILYDRGVRYNWEGGHHLWSVSVIDKFLIMALIIITSALIFFTLSLTVKKTKDDQKSERKVFNKRVLVLSFLTGLITFCCLCIYFNQWPNQVFMFLVIVGIVEVISFVTVWIIYWITLWITKGTLVNKLKNGQKQ